MYARSSAAVAQSV